MVYGPSRVPGAKAIYGAFYGMRWVARLIERRLVKTPTGQKRDGGPSRPYGDLGGLGGLVLPPCSFIFLSHYGGRER